MSRRGSFSINCISGCSDSIERYSDGITFNPLQFNGLEVEDKRTKAVSATSDFAPPGTGDSTTSRVQSTDGSMSECSSYSSYKMASTCTSKVRGDRMTSLASVCGGIGNGDGFESPNDSESGRGVRSASSPKPAADRVINEQAILEQTFRKLACSLCEAMVSHTSELRIEATVGITVDGGARVVLMHFADRVSRNEDIAAGEPGRESVDRPKPFVAGGVSEDVSATWCAETAVVKPPTSDGAGRSRVGASEVPATNGGSVRVAGVGDSYQNHSRESFASSAADDAVRRLIADADVLGDLVPGAPERDDAPPACRRQIDSDQRLLRQLLCTPPVLKQSRVVVAVEQPPPSSSAAVRCAAGVATTVGEVAPCSKPSARSTILGKLLTSQDSDAYMMMCHPHSVVAYPPLASSAGGFADDGCVPKRNAAAKRARSRDDEDEDWEPTGSNRLRYRKQSERSGGGGAAMSRSKSDQHVTKAMQQSAPAPAPTPASGQFQFSNLLHHLVSRNLSVNRPVGGSDPNLVIASVSSIREDADAAENGEWNSMSIKQEIDDSSYGVNYSFNDRVNKPN